MDILDKLIRITVTEDQMEAHLYLSSMPGDDGYSHTQDFTEELIMQKLAQEGVKAGIDKTLLKSVIINHLFDRYITIAKGAQPKNGDDGYYDYKFKTKIDNKPKILEDGSVDYHNIDMYESVSQGDLLATYVPATTGHFGFTVRGSILSIIPGKDLPPLKGSGFTVSNDNRSYYSNCNGKVELINNDTLLVTNLLDIKGDVDLTTGDIVFNGDVIIHGSVLSGSLIRTGGSLTIMGNVEGAYINVGGDIQLKSGMQGGGKGVIECDGNVWGKFFEHTIIRSKGDIHANSMMNCDVFCEGNIYISGRHGIIVGGNVACQNNIDATVIGNMAEVKTNISVGVNEHILSQLTSIEAEIKDTTDKIKKHNLILEKIKAVTNTSEPEKLNSMFVQVSESLQELNNRFEVLNKSYDQTLFLISSSSSSKIYVRKYIFPNVHIILNGLHYSTTETFTRVTIKDWDGKVCVANEPIV